MAKINAECDLTCIIHSSKVVEISAVYNNQFIRRVYVGVPYEKAREIFKQEIKKGGKLPDRVFEGNAHIQ